MNFVSPEPNSGCWLWIGARTRQGYGARFSFGRKVEGGEEPHRVAWRLFVGTIPLGRHVLHRCDVPPCVNPAHLFLGDNAENMRDMWAKGRGAHGERQGGARLTAVAVECIRRRVAAGERYDAIASDYRVTRPGVCGIARGQTWRRAGGPIVTADRRYGDLNVTRKISEVQVEQIRQRVTAGERRCDVAAAFGVSRPLVTLIMQGKIWKRPRPA